MDFQLTDSRLASIAAKSIFMAFVNYCHQFLEITQLAKKRFEQRDWYGMQKDARARLDLYGQVVQRNLLELHDLMGGRITNKKVWAGMKAVYSGLIADRNDWELAETFFNSITRRIFTTVGVDPDIEYVDTDFESPPTQPSGSVFRTYLNNESIETLIQTILKSYHFQVPFEDLNRDSRLVAQEIKKHLKTIGVSRKLERIEMIKSVFFRGQGAYLIGRMFSGILRIPLVIALVNTPRGISIDAVLFDENDISILFSFTRSYFHVDVYRPYDLVQFLKTLMPRKRIAELYISIGYNKHGKTELYRDLLKHIASSHDQFELARGEEGMVMSVFTLPTYDLVFKVIKDRFAYPKNTTRQNVMAKYRLVFKHDRAGRLIDAQEFEYLKFEKSRFSQALLEHLLKNAAFTVREEDGHIIIHHVYVERRVFPLNIYLQEAGEEAAKAAVIDYGNAIKDLAATNIFPGDLFTKNFGVTRHGRVVFYDYDELNLLTNCNFRKMPPPRSPEDELSDEPWFTAGEDDVFPEEFRHFLGLPEPLKAVFIEHHADLFEVDFWKDLQERLRNGEIIDISPYPEEKRLKK
ncbi:MAG: bifunctional isocitrate dehydrogenase kinase/phosphatase [Methanobacteriota archaeon]|nr:MAG: bifunctional isocitrate dehydrogenase kinase/phosphatase [Euryarchaeota archaeon]